MTNRFLEEQQIVLEIIAASPKPLGWYGIEIRLGMRGIILQATITTLLRRLEDEGYILHATGQGYLHGIYELTPSGRDYLKNLSRPDPPMP
jgi:DNA-binding PadR family transcriptional regulator